MINHAEALDVQLALARMTRLRVSTHQLTVDQVEYVIGFQWSLVLDEMEFDQLSRDSDNPAAFQDCYNGIKATAIRRKDFVKQNG